MPEAFLPISSSLVPVVFHFPVMPLINGALWGLKKKISLLYFCRLHAAVLLHIFQWFQPFCVFSAKKTSQVERSCIFQSLTSNLTKVDNTANFCLRIFKDEVSKFNKILRRRAFSFCFFFLEITKVRSLLLQLPLV